MQIFRGNLDFTEAPNPCDPLLWATLYKMNGDWQYDATTQEADRTGQIPEPPGVYIFGHPRGNWSGVMAMW